MRVAFNRARKWIKGPHGRMARTSSPAQEGSTLPAELEDEDKARQEAYKERLQGILPQLRAELTPFQNGVLDRLQEDDSMRAAARNAGSTAGTLRATIPRIATVAQRILRQNRGTPPPSS
jgi:hypothetical protein